MWESSLPPRPPKSTRAMASSKRLARVSGGRPGPVPGGRRRAVGVARGAVDPDHALADQVADQHPGHAEGQVHAGGELGHGQDLAAGKGDRLFPPGHQAGVGGCRGGADEVLDGQVGAGRLGPASVMAYGRRNGSGRPRDGRSSIGSRGRACRLSGHAIVSPRPRGPDGERPRHRGRHRLTTTARAARLGLRGPCAPGTSRAPPGPAGAGSTAGCPALGRPAGSRSTARAGSRAAPAPPPRRTRRRSRTLIPWRAARRPTT